MLLRDERQVALDCVIVSCKNAADAYDDAAALAEDPATESLFRELSRRREAMARELEVHMRALGDLPSDPDVESETVGQVWRHLKATFSEDARRPLVQEAAALEEQLAKCIDDALAVDLPEDTLALLRRCRDETAADRSRLPPAQSG